MLWRHQSRDQNGPKFYIRLKNLIESFSKNIFKLSCRFLNIVFKNGHYYFSWKSSAVKSTIEKFVGFLLNNHLSKQRKKNLPKAWVYALYDGVVSFFKF